MLKDGKVVRIFKLEDLNSRISFAKWIRGNIENEFQNSDEDIFASNKYLEYLKYIEEQVARQPLKNKSDWIDKIKILRTEKEKKQKS